MIIKQNQIYNYIHKDNYIINKILHLSERTPHMTIICTMIINNTLCYS